MNKLVKLSTLLMLFSCSAVADLANAISAFDKGELATAETILLSVKVESFDKNIYLAQIELANSNLDEALDLADEAIKLEPSNALAHFVRAKILGEIAEQASVFSLLGYVKEVKKSLTLAAKLESTNAEYQRALIQFHTQAPSMLGGDIELALHNAQSLRQMSAEDGSFGLLLVYDAMESQQEFQQELESSLQSYGDSANFLYMLGLFYQQKGEYQLAFSHLQKALQLAQKSSSDKPVLDKAMFQLANTAEMMGDNLAEAETHLSKFIVNSHFSISTPSKDSARFLHANILAKQGKKLQAKQLFNELVKNTSNRTIKKQAKKKLKKLKKV